LKNFICIDVKYNIKVPSEDISQIGIETTELTMASLFFHRQKYQINEYYNELSCENLSLVFTNLMQFCITFTKKSIHTLKLKYY